MKMRTITAILVMCLLVLCSGCWKKRILEERTKKLEETVQKLAEQEKRKPAITNLTPRIIDGGEFYVPFDYGHPSILLNTDWYAIVSGTVSQTNKPEEIKGLRITGGKIEVHELLFARPTQRERLVKVEQLSSDGGFDDLSVGDKVLVFIGRHHDTYAIPDYGSPCHIGLKLEGFDDPIILAVKEQVASRLLPKHYATWHKADPHGLAWRLERDSILMVFDLASDEPAIRQKGMTNLPLHTLPSPLRYWDKTNAHHRPIIMEDLEKLTSSDDPGIRRVAASAMKRIRMYAGKHSFRTKQEAADFQKGLAEAERDLKNGKLILMQNPHVGKSLLSVHEKALAVKYGISVKMPSLEPTSRGVYYSMGYNERVEKALLQKHKMTIGKILESCYAREVQK